MTWQLTSALVLVAGLAAGFGWYERDKPPARVLALVATMAALAVVGRLAFAAIPNVKPTTDIVLFAGYALGPIPGFVVGAVAALVSNIFLSQGPWTPWQMAAWGAVGIGGAAFALVLRGREPNRWVLAAVCGLAGFAFGAWMDLYHLTLAALAVAGRLAFAAIPNVVATTDIVLVAGYSVGAAPGFAVGALAGLGAAAVLGGLGDQLVLALGGDYGVQSAVHGYLPGSCFPCWPDKNKIPRKAGGTASGRSLSSAATAPQICPRPQNSGA